ncbi:MULTISPECIES: nuclear transport factor 2 family protein [Neorhizobium]|nr:MULTISPECIES: nuclear transport factor 2 family protein [Neorhizobium]MCJ9671406.1 ester cyclase [Neorhizobium sp. SHOUNA12B]MCJ9746366.1 ester cyclase [Neorhizobium sp. SHOUNA12A]
MALPGSNPIAAQQWGSAVLRYAVILVSLVVLPIPASAQAVPGPAKREGSAMTNQEAWKIYKKYLSAWNTTSIEERLKIANEVLSENIEYHTARHDLTTGRSLVIEDMATFHERFPGGHFEIGDISSHHNVALLTWVIIQADGKEFARGGDQITVGSNGQISKITTFAPSVKDPN